MEEKEETVGEFKARGGGKVTSVDFFLRTLGLSSLSPMFLSCFSHKPEMCYVLARPCSPFCRGEGAMR